MLKNTSPININSLDYYFVTQKIINISDHSTFKHELLTRFTDKNSKVTPSAELVFETLRSESDYKLFTLKQIRDITNILPSIQNIHSIAINIEPSLLDNHQIVDEVVNLKEKTNIEVTVEITERCASDFSKKHIQHVELLHNLGIKISLDDYGIGGNGLYRLALLPVSEIKIDKFFCHRAMWCNKTKLIIVKLVKMCKKLNISVIAEGIETKEMSAALYKLGISLQQGYYFDIPTPINNNIIEIMPNKLIANT